MARVLADTSAWIVARRLHGSPAQKALGRLVSDGLVATCNMVRLELLARAPNAAEFADDRAALAQLPDSPINKREWVRALDVYEQLTAQGGTHQRSVTRADLLIAAAAESRRETILHYDSDYDRIAAVTGQRTQWIVPRGSL